MGMIVDYVCMNCFFIGTTADRGTVCCEKPDIMSVKGYHTVRRTAAKRGTVYPFNPDIQKYFSTALEGSRYKGDDDEGRGPGSAEGDAVRVSDDSAPAGGQPGDDSQRSDAPDDGGDDVLDAGDDN